MWNILISFDMALIGTHVENNFPWTKNIISTTIVKTVSAMDTENEVIILGLPFAVFRNALSAISANQIELTTLDKR